MSSGGERKQALQGLAKQIKGPRPVVARAFDDTVAARPGRRLIVGTPAGANSTSLSQS